MPTISPITNSVLTVLSKVNGFEKGVFITKNGIKIGTFGKVFLYLYAVICKYTEFLINS